MLGSFWGYWPGFAFSLALALCVLPFVLRGKLSERMGRESWVTVGSEVRSGGVLQQMGGRQGTPAVWTRP
jgi:hypothetical protein